MKYNKEQLEDLQLRIDSCQQRINELLVAISKHKKQAIPLEDELVAEREIMKRLQEDFDWINYQTSCL
jgi:predicted  nucleic acid-binding Zn-ribbon protein